MLLDVMDGRSFFKKTPQLLTKHTLSRQWQLTSPSQLPLCSPQEILHAIQSHRLLRDPLGCPDSPTGEGIPILGAMHKFQAFAWPSKEHRMFTDDLTGTDHLDTDLGIRTRTNHPTSPIDCHVIQPFAPRLCRNSRQAQGCPARRIDL